MSEVRKLDWEDCGDGWLEAVTQMGIYVIMGGDRSLTFEHFKFYHFEYFEEVKIMMARGPTDELQALAQADHDIRVLRMLTPSQAPLTSI